MKVLGLDTSTFTGGAGLVADGQLVGEFVLGVAANHAERLMPAVETVLAGANWKHGDVDAISVASGPGSFTGLRIGVATAKTLAYAWGKPLIGVSTLEALAWQLAGISGYVVPALNARRARVYAAVYKVAAGGSVLPVEIYPPANLPLAQLLAELANLDGNITFTGDAAVAFAPELAQALGARWQRVPLVSTALRPGSVASLGEKRLLAGERHDPFALIPVYLRKTEAEVEWEKTRQSSPSIPCGCETCPTS